jgi:hypothetical protein
MNLHSLDLFEDDAFAIIEVSAHSPMMLPRALRFYGC